MVSSGLEALPFNRTSMELKQVNDAWHGFLTPPFNRTSMELKHNSACQYFRLRSTFNRTSMELKLLNIDFSQVVRLDF